MRRGTTCQHTFSCPQIDFAYVTKIRITYLQLDRSLTKTENDVTIDGTDIIVNLTEQETIQFYTGADVRVQVKLLTGDYVVASQVIPIKVEPILNTEVLKE